METEQPKAFRAGIGIFAILGIIFLILVVAVVAIVVLNGSGKVKAPAFSNTNAPVPSQFSAVKNSNSSVATESLVKLAQSALSNTTQLTIIYNGTFSASASGLAGLIASINSPFTIKDYKYGNDAKFDINATHVSVIGDTRLVYVNNTNGTYLCTNLNISSAYAENLGSLLQSHKLSCSNTGSVFGFALSYLPNFDFSSMLNFVGLQFDYQTVYQSEYQGVACTYMSGLLQSVAQNGTITNIGTFQMCDSDTYYVPLSFSVAASTSGGSAALTMNATVLTNSASESATASLPGPVQ